VVCAVFFHELDVQHYNSMSYYRFTEHSEKTVSNRFMQLITIFVIV